MSEARAVTRELRLLLSHELRRTRAALGRPRPGVLISVLLPLTMGIGALSTAGAGAMPDPALTGGAVGLGFLAAAPLAFLAYGIVFRATDDPFLRRLGISATALYLHRALRLLVVALGTALFLTVPFLGAGPALRPAFTLLAGGALVAWGASLLALSAAARAVAAPDRRPGFFSRLMGMDRELVRAGPLVYAPLAPLGGALLATGWIAAGGAALGGRAAVALLAAAAMAALGVRPFTRALPRFAPRAMEMSFVPPPEAGEAGLVLGRGLGRVLPARVNLVRVRDGAVAARRFRWATSIVWPVAIVGVVALARWGALPQVRAWVVAAGVLTLAAQGAAAIGLGRLERTGPQWIDRALGLRGPERWAGRWAFGFGLSLWLTVPIAIAWSVWAAAGPGWVWIAGGALTASVAAGASLGAAGR